MRTVADGCGRLRTVANIETTDREQDSTPRPPELNENPSLRIRQKGFEGCAYRDHPKAVKVPASDSAEPGEQFVDQGIWANVSPMRFEGGLAQIFPLPFGGRSGERTCETTIQEQQQREETVPEEPEEPSPKDTLMQPGTGSRFDVLTQRRRIW